jgi:hypothetical protein
MLQVMVLTSGCWSCKELQPRRGECAELPNDTLPACPAWPCPSSQPCLCLARMSLPALESLRLFAASCEIPSSMSVTTIQAHFPPVCRDPAAVAQARADFARWHAVDLERKRCMVFRCPDTDKELVLVPVRIKTGADKASLPFGDLDLAGGLGWVPGWWWCAECQLG